MSKSIEPFPLPSKLLEKIASNAGLPIAIALCPNFEGGNWRYKQLAEHLFDWLPDVALRPRERLALLYEPNKQLARSCRRMFDVSDPSARGEIGEILLHAACRQEFGTTPVVSRLFYKMRSNDSVTSVDSVHVLENPESKELEIWLGEAKLYGDVDTARYSAFKSIEPLWHADFLGEMKALIGPKIERSHPLSEKLQWLFQEETSLDAIVDRIVIPICIAADWPETATSTDRSITYIEKVKIESDKINAYFAQRVPANVTFVTIFIPLDTKNNLEQAMHSRIASYL